MMGPLAYFLSLAVCFLGLGAGAAVANMAREELKEGLKYFLLLMRILIILVFVATAYSFRTNYFILAGLVLFAIVSLLLSPPDQRTYMMLGIVFFLSQFSQELFILDSALIFLYGMAVGSILAEQSQKRRWRVMALRLWEAGKCFLVGPILLYLAYYGLKP
jgi:uncharacterized membrane protein YhhN